MQVLINKSLFLHNPENIEYGYINEPTKLINLNLFNKNGKVGIIADVDPLIRDNLNLDGKLYRRIIIAPIGFWKENEFVKLTNFPIEVQVIFTQNESSDIPEDWYENKYFIGTITDGTME